MFRIFNLPQHFPRRDSGEYVSVWGGPLLKYVHLCLQWTKVAKVRMITAFAVLFIFATFNCTAAEALTPEILIERLKCNRPPETMAVEFLETRHYQLKKVDLQFRGTMRLHPDHGISIEYTDPTNRIIILNPSGLRIRQPGETTDKLAPEEATAVVSVFMDLLQLNESRLKEQFSMKTKSSEDEAWVLELSPIQSELKRILQFIDLEGSDAVPTAIVLHRGRNRWQRIEFLEKPQPWEPTPETIALYF